MKQTFDISSSVNHENFLKDIKKAFENKVENVELIGNSIVVVVSDDLSFRERYPIIQSIFEFIEERLAMESIMENNQKNA